jgi:hypothetical protein
LIAEEARVTADLPMAAMPKRMKKSAKDLLYLKRSRLMFREGRVGTLFQEEVVAALRLLSTTVAAPYINILLTRRNHHP